jgi:hypothetical protein
MFKPKKKGFGLIKKRLKKKPVMTFSISKSSLDRASRQESNLASPNDTPAAAAAAAAAVATVISDPAVVDVTNIEPDEVCTVASWLWPFPLCFPLCFSYVEVFLFFYCR